MSQDVTTMTKFELETAIRRQKKIMKPLEDRLLEIENQTIKTNTMTTQQVLEVLKEYQSTRLDDPDFYDDWRYTQALTIAIECMEARKDEIMKAVDAGWEAGVVYRESGDAEQYYNSLTRPQSDTEMYLDSCDKCYAMTNHRDGICLKCEHLTNPNTPIR